MGTRAGSRSIFLLSLGLAAGLHGAALAYALSWQRRAEVETKIDDIITVEIVDAAMIEDETTPEPPTDKLPSAAAKASDAVPVDAAPERDQAASDSEKPAHSVASAAPVIGEPERRLRDDDAKPREPVEVRPEQSTNATSAPPDAAQTSSEAPLEPEAEASVPDAEPPNTEADAVRVEAPEVSAPDATAEPVITAFAPPADEAAVTLPPPVTSSMPQSDTHPSALAPALPPIRTRTTIRHLRMAALAARPLPKKEIEALRPRPKNETKLSAKLEPEAAASKKKASKQAKPEAPKTEKETKKLPAKGKRLAALAVDGEGTEIGAPKPGKAKLKGNGKAGAKSGKGVSGATTSGQAGIGSYWNSVRAKVSRKRGHNSSGRRGVVVVAIGVTRSGGLQFARISQSSGVAALDQAALAAVRRAAPFPPPPAGAPAALLLKSVKLDFR